MNDYGLWATYSFIISGKEINVVARDVENATVNANEKYKKERAHK